MSIAVFCGNLAGVRALHALESEDLVILCVVTVSDSYLPEISKIAERQNAKIFVDIDPDDKELQKFIHGRAAIGLSFSYPRLVPEETIRAFVRGAYNFHPAALPSYRGCFPTAWPIINNESWTAYTLHKMTSKYDEGDIIDQLRVQILLDDTGWSLYLRLIDKLSDIIHRNIANLISGSLVLNPQVESDAHYYSRKIPFDGLIQWDWTFDRIERFVRALRHPQYSGASVLFDGHKYEISDIVRIKDRKTSNSPSPEMSNGLIVGRCEDASIAFSINDSNFNLKIMD